jgi:hypothetical protein
MTFDASVNLGHVLTLVGLVATAISAWYSLRYHVALLNERMQTLSEKTSGIASELKLQTEILVRLERQELEIGVLREQLKQCQAFHNLPRYPEQRA